MYTMSIIVTFATVLGIPDRVIQQDFETLEICEVAATLKAKEIFVETADQDRMMYHGCFYKDRVPPTPHVEGYGYEGE